MLLLNLDLKGNAALACLGANSIVVAVAETLAGVLNVVGDNVRDRVLAVA